MGSEVEALEEKLSSLLGQLQAECGVLERMVYKNKNQHRRCSYFQHLLKVRRDLRLLQSAKLEELVSSCFVVITGKKPKQKVHLLESLKRRKCEGGTYNFMERLLGAARILSQMVEPMLKAAVGISVLLARSFFMGFSMTILALLARIRVLVQQILLDVVSIFNMVSSLSLKKQSVKITQQGLEVFREIFPTKEEYITLECVWESEKFVLLERTHKNEAASHVEDLDSLPASSVQYQSIEAFLADDGDENHTANHDPALPKHYKTDLLPVPSTRNDDEKQVEGSPEVGEASIVSETPITNQTYLLSSSSFFPTSNASKLKSGSRRVAFLAVKNPLPSTATPKGVPTQLKETETKSDNKEDPFFSLLTAGNTKDSFF
ncbi:hypothetical protein UlMin_003522 [Ulmus minor]